MSTDRAPKRVLLYRLGSLGDTVIALPAFHLVARAFPDAERRLLTSFPPNAKAPASSAILEHTGLVHGYFRYTLRTRSLGELVRLWWQLLRWRPEVLVYIAAASGIPDARRNALFFRLCGIRRLIGVPLTDDMQHSRPLPSPPGELDPRVGTLYEQEGSRLARNLAELGDPRYDDPASWNLHLTPAEHARADEVLRPADGYPLLAVSVGTKMQAKDWGQENWRALLVRLAALLPDHALALCGAPNESEASEFAAEGWREHARGPVLNLCGALSPRESAAVMSHAVAFLGHDSGPMHLASVVGTPCVALFSARRAPGIWYPFGAGNRLLYHHVDCEGCELETCIVEQKKCLLSITVDEVLAAIAEVLPRSSELVQLR